MWQSELTHQPRQRHAGDGTDKFDGRAVFNEAVAN